MRFCQTAGETEAHMIESEILPHLGNKRVNEIAALNIFN